MIVRTCVRHVIVIINPMYESLAILWLGHETMARVVYLSLFLLVFFSSSQYVAAFYV